MGRTLLSLAASPPSDIELLLERCRDATASELESRTMTARCVFVCVWEGGLLIPAQTKPEGMGVLPLKI